MRYSLGRLMAQLAGPLGCLAGLWSVQAAVRLCADQSDSDARPGGGAAEFLCRSTSHVSLEALEATLTDTYDRTASIIDEVLARERTDETD